MRRAGLILAMLVFVAMPVGAGAAGHASLAMLAFAGLFLLGNAVMRPASVRLDRPGELALHAVTAGAFAALLVGLGQSARALLQIEGSVDLFGWVFAGAWALVLARIVWPPQLNDRAARSAEAALREVHRAGERARESAAEGDAELPRPTRRGAPKTGPAPAAAPASQAPAPAQGGEPAPRSAREVAAEAENDPPRIAPSLLPAFAALDAVPQDAPLEEVRAALRDVEAAGEADRIFEALRARAVPEAPLRDRRALLLHAVDPGLGARRPGAGEAATAFEAIVAAADARSLGDFIALAGALLDAAPEARDDLPGVARLIEIADQIEDTHEDQAEALVSLAHRIEDLALEAENGADA